MMKTLFNLNSNPQYSICEVHTIGFSPISPLKKCVYTTLSNRRQYCSSSEQVEEKALMIIDNSHSATSEKCMYKNIITIENLESGLKRTKSGVSAGLDGEIKANYLDSKKLITLSERLKSHKYQTSPTKKV